MRTFISSVQNEFTLTDSFVTTIRRPAPGGESSRDPSGSSPNGQVTPPVTPPVAMAILIHLIGASGPLGSSEILEKLGLGDRTHLRERYINPALADGLVERTIPEKPTSRLQKYRLTEKGRAVLSALEQEKGESRP